MGPPGLEPGNVTPSETKDLQNPAKQGGAESGAVDAQTVQTVPDLQALAKALASLSPDDRKRLFDMLEDGKG